MADPRDWLVLDVSSLARQQFHGRGGGDPVGSILGTFYDAAGLCAELEIPDSRVVWTFDRAPYLRKKLLPTYKVRPVRAGDGEASALDDLKLRLDKLRRSQLAQLGYANVFSADGFEADDVMAVLARNLPAGDRCVLASADRDLYQCLSPRCAVYHPGRGGVPGRLVTAKTFRREYGVEPRLWAEVKALTGCTTDAVPGMFGVGEQTALRFFAKRLSGTPRHEAILAYNRSAQYALNHRLVRLPFEGCPEFEIDPAGSRVTPDAWRYFADSLGAEDAPPPRASVRDETLFRVE